MTPVQSQRKQTSGKFLCLIKRSNAAPKCHVPTPTPAPPVLLRVEVWVEGGGQRLVVSEAAGHQVALGPRTRHTDTWQGGCMGRVTHSIP